MAEKFRMLEEQRAQKAATLNGLSNPEDDGKENDSSLVNEAQAENEEMEF